jgi:hypothetical protein
VIGTPKQRYDRWWDANGVHVGDGARVEQIAVDKQWGRCPAD